MRAVRLIGKTAVVVFQVIVAILCLITSAVIILSDVFIFDRFRRGED